MIPRIGASGIYFADLIQRLGIASEIDARATITSGFTVASVDNAIADVNGIYLASAQRQSASWVSTVEDKVSPQGSRVWRYFINKDVTEHNWPTFAFGQILLEDDGLILVERKPSSNLR